jgi:cytochrome c oxidase subunit III
MIAVKNRALKQLLWVGMGSIAMFFAGLTSAYIVRKAEGNWTEFILPEWFWYSTITIIFSSAVLILAKQKIKKDKSIFSLVLSVFILGGLFSFFQLNGWKELINQGVYLTGEGSNVAGSFLYVLTLSHLVHLIGGLIALLVTAINAKRNKYNAKNYLGLEITSIYWHFLSILWIYLFFFLKYL